MPSISCDPDSTDGVCCVISRSVISYSFSRGGLRRRLVWARLVLLSRRRRTEPLVGLVARPGHEFTQSVHASTPVPGLAPGFVGLDEQFVARRDGVAREPTQAAHGAFVERHILQRDAELGFG